MRLAFSAIAWRPDEDVAVRELFAAKRVTAIEGAPSKIGKPPLELTKDDLLRYREFWAEKSIDIVAMQALLFGRAELKLFGTDAEREEFIQYLGRIVQLGGTLGARVLVFGSPGNRKRGALDDATALAIAAPVFRELGAIAVDHGTCLCIEPNPPEYGCDWIHSVAQARALVDFVAHPGFGLHVDAAAIQFAGEDAAVLREHRGSIRHFHASEPQLAPLRQGTGVPHARYAEVLREVGGVPVVSIEMRQVEATASNLPHLERAIDFVEETYFRGA